MKQHKFEHQIFKPLKSRNTPKVFLFTDTETAADKDDTDNIQLFKIGWIFVWKSDDKPMMKYVTDDFFDNAGIYNAYIESHAIQHKNITVIGHNIFFDLQCAGFFKYFTDHGWQLDWLYDKGLTYILRIVKDKFKIMIISSTNYYDCKLEDLGDMIGVPKIEIDLKKARGLKLKRYCHRDTEIVCKGIWHYLQFIKDNDLGRMALTKSSQALIAFRTRFMNTKIYKHTEKAAFEIERKAYFGGRTEAFFIGDVPGSEFLYIDFNSMYPYVMSKYKYPVKMVMLIEDEPDKRYTEFMGQYGLIAEVDLHIPEPVFAVRYNSKLVFPTGEFRTFLCSEGLKYAQARGYIKKFIRGAFYQMDDIFSEYVNYFSDLRGKYQDENNKVMTKLCKYMHNTLYGKWAEREIVTDMVESPSSGEYNRKEIWDAVNGGFWTETHFMNQIIVQHYEGEGSHSMPAIASHITENARMELWKLIKAVGIKKVLYCDTDSIIIHTRDLKLVKKWIHPSRMGAVKIQDRFNELRIDGAKNYRTDKFKHIKGIPEKAEEVTPGVFRFDSFQRQAACLKDSRISGVRITSVTRELKHKYNKGIVHPDGRVTPHHFTFFEPLPEQP